MDGRQNHHRESRLPVRSRAAEAAAASATCNVCVFCGRNGYSLYCAELMVNMKDVPSTERMVLCSKQWKMMTQKEKDMFQKRCEQVGISRSASDRQL